VDRVGHALIAALTCFVASVIACEVIRVVALRRALLDAPNERSLHEVPKPRLGGVAIVIVTLGALCIAWEHVAEHVKTVAIAACAIGLVGLVDDVRPLSARVRIVIQLAAAAVLLWRIGIPPFLLGPDLVIPCPSFVTAIVLVVWVVGVLNIYNFMDGMDGLAGCQTVGGAVAYAIFLGGMGSAVYMVPLAASALGFLAHNYPPSRMFMGDAGSTFIGTSFAALAVVGMHDNVPLAMSALPLAPFLLDGTFTIFRRAARREPVWQAHRSHLYQRAVQTGLDHRAVLLVYVVWIAVVVSGGILAAQLGRSALAGGWLVALVGLVAVWSWVRHREAAAS
jgi:UDP-N-acetylmuramyl pentapeptide phosphotransferase/UDP-N-acetylglucosamine-1-phosphate transferase